MKKILHQLNVLTIILLLVEGIVMIVRQEQLFGEHGYLIVACSLFQIVMGIVVFLMGAIFPKNPRPISKKGQSALKILMLLASLGGKNTFTVNAHRMINEKLEVRRVWEPTLIFIWLLIQVLFYMLLLAADIRFHFFIILSVLLLTALFISSLLWKIADEKERGTYRLHRVLLPLVIVGMVLGIGAGLSFFLQQENKTSNLEDQWQGKGEELGEMQEKIDVYLQEKPDLFPEQIEEIQKQMKEITNVVYEEDIGEINEGLSMEELVQRIASDFYPEDVYYKIVEENVVAWTLDGEDIIVYQLAKNEDGYMIVYVFASSSLSKDDVTGKEDGVWHFAE